MVAVNSMDLSDSRAEDVKGEEEDTSSVVEGSIEAITDRNATFQDKLDLSSFGYSRAASLRSASKPSPITKTENLVETDGESGDGKKTVAS